MLQIKRIKYVSRICLKISPSTTESSNRLLVFMTTPCSSFFIFCVCVCWVCPVMILTQTSVTFMRRITIALCVCCFLACISLDASRKLTNMKLKKGWIPSASYSLSLSLTFSLIYYKRKCSDLNEFYMRMIYANILKFNVTEFFFQYMENGKFRHLNSFLSQILLSEVHIWITCTVKPRTVQTFRISRLLLKYLFKINVGLASRLIFKYMMNEPKYFGDYMRYILLGDYVKNKKLVAC